MNPVPKILAGSAATLAFVVTGFGQHQPPAFEWATRIDSPYFDGWSIAVDSAGNPIVGGQAVAMVDLGVTNIVETAPNSAMGVVLRVNPAGEYLDGLGLLGTGQAQVTKVLPRPDGLVIAGSVSSWSETDFGGITLSPTNSQNGFLASYDSGSHLNWVLRGVTDAGEHNWFADIGKGSAGDMVVFGAFSGPFVDLNGVQAQNKSVVNDMMLASVTDSGAVNWVKSFGGAGDEYPISMAVDPTGDIIISGHFNSGTLAFGDTTLVNAGEYDVFVGKLSSAGEPLWATSFGSSKGDFCYAVAVDPRSQEIWVSSSTTGEPGPAIRKLSPGGNLLWTYEGGNEAFDGGALGLAVDADGNGYSCGTSSVGPAIWKIDSRGNLAWRKTQLGGTAYDSFLYGLVIAPDENIYVVGEFYAAEVQLDQFVISKFDDTPSSPTGFIAKLAADPPSIRSELVSDQLVLSWPTNQSGFLLEANSLPLEPAEWQSVTTTEQDGRHVSTNSVGGEGRVFRLRKNPEP